MPVAGRKVKAHLESGGTTRIDILAHEVAARQVVAHAYAILGWPEGIAVVVTGGKHGIGEPGVMDCREETVGKNGELAGKPVITLGTVITLAAIAVVLYHVPGRLDAVDTVYAPVHKQAERCARVPLGVRMARGHHHVVGHRSGNELLGPLHVGSVYIVIIGVDAGLRMEHRRRRTDSQQCIDFPH